MRPTPNLMVERYRVRHGRLASSRFDGNNGAFVLPGLTRRLVALVSDGGGWEHVSVRPEASGSTPTWEEMCYAKDLFWGAEEEVVQYHPRRSEYVNLHPDVLHLWRPTDSPLVRPPAFMVGPRLGMAGGAHD